MKITKTKIDKIRKDVSAALKAANRSDEIETRGCATAEFQTYELDTGEEWDGPGGERHRHRQGAHRPVAARCRAGGSGDAG